MVQRPRPPKSVPERLRRAAALLASKMSLHPALMGRNQEFIDFVQHFVPPSLLGRLNERISDQDARKIASTMTDWEIRLVSPLKLTRGEVADLNEERRPQIRRVNVVMTWKDRMAKKKEDTFGNLLACCLEGGDTPTAENICNILIQGGQANPPPQQAYPQQYGGNHPTPQNYPPPQPPGGYQPLSYGQQPQYQQQYPPQQQGGYHQGANVSNPGGLNKDTALLTTKDQTSVTKYLRELSNHEIIKIGVELGLDFIKLKRIKEEYVMDDMVLAWLRKDDRVGEISGDPSWKTLCTALKECGHTGIADKVKAEGGQANPPLQQTYQPAHALPGYYPHFGPPQPPGGYQPSSYGQQQPQHQQLYPPQQYAQQQGGYHQSPPQNGHYQQAQNFGANVPNGSSLAPNPGAAAVPGYPNSMPLSAAVGSGGTQPLNAQHQPAGEIVVRSEDVNFLMTYLHKNAYKWREIGSSLNFLHGELENISHSNPRATTSQLLTTLLNQWCQWPTSDHRHHPTMERLRDALRSGPVGLGATANDLYAQRNSLPSRQRS